MPVTNTRPTGLLASWTTAAADDGDLPAANVGAADAVTAPGREQRGQNRTDAIANTHSFVFLLGFERGYSSKGREGPAITGTGVIRWRSPSARWIDEQGLPPKWRLISILPEPKYYALDQRGSRSATFWNRKAKC